MLFDEKLDADIRGMIHQWNIAEERIKRAENVRDGEVVAAAIFELRYAGRKIIEMLEAAVDCDIAENIERRQAIATAIDEAKECCVKSKHDAIDSVLTFLTIWFNRAQKRLPLATILQVFPDYIAKIATIRDIQRKIEASRRDRLDRREAIYDAIAENEYKDLLDLYRRMSLSAHLVQRIVSRERRNRIIYVIFSIAMLIFGFSGLVNLVRHW